jgi:hypothetical protein
MAMLLAEIAVIHIAANNNKYNNNNSNNNTRQPNGFNKKRAPGNGQPRRQ